MQTAALVSRTGSVDWLCLPRFDSDAVLAALLGDKFNGQWQLSPTAALGPPSWLSGVERAYEQDTLILTTLWETVGGTVRVIDFMPPRKDLFPVLVRIVEGIAGAVEMESVLRLRFGYGAIVPWVRRVGHSICAAAGPDSVWVTSPVKLVGRDLPPPPTFALPPAHPPPFFLTCPPPPPH